MKRLKIYFAFSCVLVLFLSLKPDSNQVHGKKNVKLEFVHFVGNNLLKLNGGNYTNALGQDYKISHLKYYISNVKLYFEDGSRLEDPGYFLIDEELTSSKNIELFADPDKYTAVEFMIGIDSTHNCSGAQVDELDPAYGMFWTWNTGYIFMKMEGTSSVSTHPKKQLEYHIGGYKDPANCMRLVKLELKPTTADAKINQVRVKVDLAEMFTHPADIDFKAMPVVNDHNNAVMMANNYTDMFSVMDIK